MKTTTLIKRFAPYFKPYTHVLLFDLFCAGLTSACDVVLPLLVRSLAQQGINDLSGMTFLFDHCFIQRARRSSTRFANQAVVRLRVIFGLSS